MNARCLSLEVFVCAAPLLVIPLSGAPPIHQSPDDGFTYAAFKNPPAEYRGRAMWGFDLSTVTEAEVVSGVQELARKDRFGGLFVTVNGGNGKNLDPVYVRQAAPHLRFFDHGIEYLSPEFFKLYRVAVQQAKENGLSFVLYDDYEYPTGTVGGQLYTKYPQYMAKRLDMVEKDVAGPGKVELAIPGGVYVGAILMNRDTHERVEVSAHKKDSRVECDISKGNWKLMVFYLNRDAVLKIRNPGLVDYLDEDAMNTFLALSYQKFYDHLQDYFGTVINMSFFDEPTLHWLDGRTWTPSFNSNFQKKYGYSPMKYYPALWYDIGPETAAARNALFGFRAQLFADNFVWKIEQWCKAHGIQASGHLDQEEAPNPVPINGDLMKVFEHQDIPGHDDIFFLGRSNRGYKVVTSAAYNYDKPVVMAETYAAYTKLDDRTAFRTAMDQFAMGINLQLPWAGITHYVKNMKELNDYVGRLSYLLQHGRHVADVAVLYPIASLQTCYTFAGGRIADAAKPDTDRSVTELAKAMGPAWEYAYNGGVPPPEIDYMDLGEILYRGLRVDYTYLHPEVFENRCAINKSMLILNNRENREEYRVFILPGGDTVSSAVARKIVEFYRNGGSVISTSKLPFKSAEFGQDREVQQAIGEVFGIPAAALVSGDIKIDRSAGYFVHRNGAGGRAFFLPKAQPELMKTVLGQVIPIRDVAFQEEMWPLENGRAYNGALTYLHKVRKGRDIYFFANSSEKQVDTNIVLRGVKQLSIWNPHTGEREPVMLTHAKTDGVDITTTRLLLPPVSSLFYIQEDQSASGR